MKLGRYRLRSSTSLFAAFTALGPGAGIAAAQAVVTNITADTTLPTNTVVNTSGNLTTITGGTTFGSNLFHSFNNFDLAAGGTAGWQGPNAASYSNVINRVTGGNVSDIHGLIDSSQFSNADFYFINPAGVVMGAGASLNVPAGFALSTADSLHFTDGAVFAVTTPSGSVLTSASPSAFGFLASNTAALAIDGLDYLAPSGPLSPQMRLAAHNVSIANSNLRLRNSRASFAGFANSASLSIEGTGDGVLNIANSAVKALSVFSESGAAHASSNTVRIDGFQTATLIDSLLSAESTWQRPAGSIVVSDVDALRLTHSIIETSVLDGQGFGGDITIAAGSLNLDTGRIAANSLGFGSAGSILIKAAGDVTLSGASMIDSQVGVFGSDVGSIAIESGGNLTIGSGSRVLAATGSGVAPPDPSAPGTGTIKLRGANVSVGQGAAVQSTMSRARNAGSIEIVATAGDVQIGSSLGGAFVQSIANSSSATGRVGSVTIAASGDLRLTGGHTPEGIRAPTKITASASLAAGAAGSISLAAGGSVRLDEVDVASEAGDPFIRQRGPREIGAPAAITIAGHDISVVSSRVSSSSTDRDGSNISLVAPGAIVLSRGQIDSGTRGSGFGGSIRLTSDSLTMRNSQVFAGTGIITFQNGYGPGGDIFVDARVIDVRNDVENLAEFGPVFIPTSFGTGTAADGRAGSIVFSRPDSSIYLENATIEATASQSGDAGNISIVADSIVLKSAELESSTFPGLVRGDTAETASAGNIHVTARTFSTSRLPEAAGGNAIRSSTQGAGNAGDIRLDVFEQLSLVDTEIAATTLNSGNAGNVIVSSPTAEVTLNRSTLSTVTYGSGNAGTIGVLARSLDLEGASEIASAVDEKIVDDGFLDTEAFTFTGSGSAGQVSITTSGDVSIRDSSRVSSDVLTEVGRDAGRVGITSGGQLQVVGASRVSTSTVSQVTPADPAAPGTGSVRLEGASVLIDGASEIVAGSDGARNAGSIVISSGGAFMASGGSSILSSTQESGDAGAVTITAGSIGMDGASFGATSAGLGDAGRVSLHSTAGSIDLVRSNIATVGSGAAFDPDAVAYGAAGSISLNSADDINVISSNLTSQALNQSKRAGGIDITAADKVTVGFAVGDTNGGFLSVLSNSTGPFEAPPAGEAAPGIRITGASISLEGVGERTNANDFVAGRVRITAETTQDQPAGAVRLTATNGSVNITRSDILGQTVPSDFTAPLADRGAGAGGSVAVSATQDVSVSNSILSAISSSRGDAGAVNIAAGRDFNLSALSTVTSASSGAGKAGNVAIAIGRTGLIDGLSRIDTDISGSASGAGQVSVTGANASLTITGSVGGLNPVRSAISSSTGNSLRGGGVNIDVGQLNLLAGATILATSSENASGAGGDVRVNATGVLVDAASIASSSFGSGSAGSVTISTTGNTTVRNGSAIESAVNGPSGGDAGQVIMTSTAGQLTLGSSSRVSTSTNATSPPSDPSAAGTGAITMRAAHVIVDGASVVTANTTGARNAGSIDIRATAGNTLLGSGSGGALITSTSSAAGGAGSVSISAASDVRTSGGTNISTNAAGANTRRSGSVSLTAGNQIDLSQTALSASTASAIASTAATINLNAAAIATNNATITTDTAGAQSAGAVRLNAAREVNLQSSVLSSLTSSTGSAGAVSVTSNTFTMNGGSLITSAFDFVATPGVVQQLGNAGDVRVNASQIDIRNAIITSTTEGAGNAGQILFDQGSANILLQNTSVSSETRSAGAGGAVVFAADVLRLIDSDIFSGPVDIDGSLDATGAGGDISIQARRLEVTGTAGNSSTISSSTSGPGAAGDVSVRATEAITLSAGFIGAESFEATGRAGAVSVIAPLASLRMSNGSAIQSASIDAVGDAGAVDVSVRTLDMTEGSSITSSAQSIDGTGGAPIGATGRNAGNVKVSVTGNATLNGSAITSDADGAVTRNAGSVQVAIGGALSLAAGSEISAKTSSQLAKDGLSKAASVSVSAASLEARGASGISTSSTGARDAGSITVNSPGIITLSDRSGIQSVATGLGAAGSISIGSSADKAALVNVQSGSTIATSSANATTAGSISIFATDVVVDGVGSLIASENSSLNGGAAGSILIDVDPITISNGGAITTNAVSGAAGDITINLPANGLMFLTGASNLGTITTSSGIGTGGQININNPLAIISNGGQILALGEAGGANVQISSDFFISSTDRLNVVSVDGSLQLDSSVQDVSQGADPAEVTFVDPLGVMRGRCPVVRAGGETSRLGLIAPGPYVLADAMRPSVRGLGRPSFGCQG